MSVLLKGFQGPGPRQVVVDADGIALHLRNTRYVHAAATSRDNLQDTNQGTADVPKESKTPVGAIAGGVVGGVAGVSFIGVLAWWLLRRKRGAAAGGYVPTQYEMDGSSKPTELAPREYMAESPASGLAGKESPLPAELDTPVAELDGSNPVFPSGPLTRREW